MAESIELIEDFKSIIAQRDWGSVGQSVLENIQRRLQGKLLDGVAFSLTKFQREALASDQFWRQWDDEEDASHCMIQGATSAGKTLLSELSILDTLIHGGRAIVLVPLKAMVHERTEQFKTDFEGCYKQIYGSSSDYLENDERIINAEYQVAVIVYEKFFAMLSQGSDSVMNGCRLVVVDELSMLSKAQRGPKLEIAMETVSTQYRDARIMCLATCDCGTTKISRWLGIDPGDVIMSAARPIALEEHILALNGRGYCRTIPADEDERSVLDKMPDEIEIEGYDEGWKRPEKRRALLKAVLERELEKNPSARILVFVGRRRDTVGVAEYLKKDTGLFKLLDTSKLEQGDLRAKLQACDVDADQHALITSYLPWGIAFHHAGLSTMLREVIEEDFQDRDSSIQVIVATETLTVGVNLPFDVMIIMDNMVPRGKGRNEPITMQEYRNFIGRAGRLGLSNYQGTSYIFVEDNDLDYYWKSYNSSEEVESALTRASEAEVAPYYLSLIKSKARESKGLFSKKTVDALYESSLSKICRSPLGTDSEELLQRGGAGRGGSGRAAAGLDSEELIGQLMENQLASKIKAVRAKLPTMKKLGNYKLTKFGELIAPYALSLDTSLSIATYFLHGSEYGFMPAGITKETINDDVYLLDILFHVCLDSEIQDLTYLMFPREGSKSNDNVIKAKKAFYKILSELLEDPAVRLWYTAYASDEELREDAKELSELHSLLYDSDQDESQESLQAAMRAIILYYWTKGMTIEDIGAKTGFSQFLHLINGDVERLAELASFHLDAIERCTSSATTRDHRFIFEDIDATHAFYSLQTRVKYGMSRDLIKLANKHVHGLDRANLLALAREAKKLDMTPLHYFYSASPDELERFMTRTQRHQLKKELEIHGSDEFNVLMDQINTEITEQVETGLKNLYTWSGAKDGAERELYASLNTILSDPTFSSLFFRLEVPELWAFSLRLQNDDAPAICFGALRRGFQRRDIERLFSEFFSLPQYRNLPHVILIQGGYEPSGDQDQDLAFSEREEAFRLLSETVRRNDCNAILDTKFLAKELASAFEKELDNGKVLFELLNDLRGIVYHSDSMFFSLNQYLDANDGSQSGPRFRLLMSYKNAPGQEGTLTAHGLEQGLAEMPGLDAFEVLPWGRPLLARLEENGLVDVPNILMIHRNQVIHSASLNEFMMRMYYQQFRQSKMLFPGRQLQKEWDNPTMERYETGNVWNAHYATIPQASAVSLDDALLEIGAFVDNWSPGRYQIGISYPHYDNQYDVDDADHVLISRLADRLRRRFGESAIFFDEFEPAHHVFSFNGGQTESWDCYRSCKVSLILWNHFISGNGNCESEIQAIQEACSDHGARCIYLTPVRSDNPPVPAGSFGLTLCEGTLDLIVDEVAYALGQS